MKTAKIQLNAILPSTGLIGRSISLTFTIIKINLFNETANREGIPILATTTDKCLVIVYSTIALISSILSCKTEG